MIVGPNAIIVVPPVIGDNTYILRRFDGTPDVTITGGEPHILGPNGVRKFQILGIELADGVDSENPRAFVTGIATTEPGLSQLKMTAITVLPSTDPIANTGADQTVNEGDTVTLDGSASSDPKISH